MRFQDFEVLHAQIASKTPGISQLLELEAQLDAASGTMTTRFFNVDSTTGKRHEEHFASGLVSFEDPSRWTAEWSRVEHLILGRIDALDQLAATGKASRLNKNMAYTLFKNVVDYADRYRGIDDVVINDHEAFANITLTNDRHGSHHTPPHWIDSVCHLAGLIMNGSDASNTRDYFYVTPGCESFRLHKPLEAGGKYRSYVRMFQLPSENFGGSIVYGGDVYIFQGDTVVGMVGQIRFRRVPRMLMDRFFIAPDAKTSTSHAAPVAALKPASTVAVAAFKKDAPPVPIKKAQLSTPPASIPITPQRIDITPSKQQAKPRFGPVEPLTPPSEETLEKVYPEPIAAAAPATPAPSVTEITIEAPAGVAGHCLQVIARETNLPMESLADEAAFADLGIDSLLSLVLAEKFRAEVGIEIKSSLFLECPTIGEMKAWLTQNC
jgi:asperthecin polyketide synthase